MVSSEIHDLDWRHIQVILVSQVIIFKELPMFWLILINNKNENYCIWSTSYSGNTVHRHSLSVRHTGRCLLRIRMMNINISHKYSNASHSSLMIWFLFHMSQRKLTERENWSQIRNLNVSPQSLSLKVSCETSRSKVSLFALSPSLPTPNHITCSPVLRIRRSHLKWCHLHRNPTILEWYHLLQPKRSFFSQIS